MAGRSSSANGTRMRRNIIIISALFVWMAGTALADTLYLIDGTAVKGTFIGFENGQFTFEAGDGSQTKYQSRRVSRLVIDRSERSGDAQYRRNPQRGASTASSTAGTSSGRWESVAPFDVRLADQWIRSEIEVYKGQQVRVQATGTVTLEGQTVVNPEGLRNQRDSYAPMPNENDGALIAVIGKDPDAPSILIGRQQDFIADRDGMLYFTVNHWETRNAKGAFRVNVSVDRGTRGWTGDSTDGTLKRQKIVTVSGTQAWTDTGIDLESGGTIEIIAEGQITISANRRTGPDGDRNANVRTSTYPIQSSGVGALIARIRYRNGNDSRLRFIGSSNQMRIGSGENGRLFIGVNDDVFSDNGGSYRVTIRW
jgi:hypothetical protein